jgi:hypothetical protein
MLAVDQFGGEDLVARHVRPCDGVANTFLVPVSLSRVEQPVTGLERTGDGRGRLVGRDEKHTESELRDGDAVVERE